MTSSKLEKRGNEQIMGELQIVVTSELSAPPSAVYALLSDYQKGHPAILPKAFTQITVLQGGQGAGTVVRADMRTMGQNSTFHLTVTEPEPGRVLVEEDAEAGVHTTFTVEPLDGGTRSRVTIASIMRGPRGPLAWLQGPMMANYTRKLYREELAKLDAYVRQQTAL